ncbi:flagellar export chaperone FliS [Sutcliffiella cohnii]|uniref:flagellar export chaperone FliS n=1 Tax=Sutcliffiella cohnii TaxID=33932 RepID=UPI002E1E3266|nr:flagellar export chaperone FliS [Sutcliffiella cohnii]MED4019122.1 flagellar export chaperone FliS [Sutcliffiella cohnii]
MAMNNPYKAYQENSVTTASPGELTIMLYNGAIKNVKLAKQAIQDSNISAKHTHLIKAQDIVRELMVTLNMDIEISKSLMAMYDYINRRLVEANTTNSTDILVEAEGYLVELRDTWKEVIKINRQKQFGQGGQV